jgi:glycosyltransferase involved in cell wall biosynthesis
MRSPPDVALFLPTMAGGGAERIFLELAAGFAGRGLETQLIVGSTEGSLSGEVPEGVTAISLGVRRITAAVPRLARHLRAVPPRALLSAMSHANAVALVARSLARVRTRVVVTEHQHLSTMLAYDANLRDRALPAVMRLLYPRADCVVAVSHGVADNLAERAGLRRSNIDVVYNPIDLERIRRLAEARAEHPWIGDDGPPLIVAAGRLAEQKDFGTLIDAVSGLPEGTCRLLILGEGPLRADLAERIVARQVEDRVQLPGFVDNPYPFFSAARVVAMSSRWEGLPTVLLEALALGARVVSTDCPSGPREILRGGGLGVLVPTEDPAALADGIRAALHRPSAEEFDAHPFEPGRVLDEYLKRMFPDGAR